MKRQWLAAMVAVIAGMAMEACSAETGAVRVPEYLELKSRSLTLRQDLTRGGAIGYIAKAGEVRNFVNIADEGRYIQQSYYGGRSVDRRSEGQAETWSPWAWNPIQVGDYARNRAQITTFRKRHHSTYVACIPMQWDMDGHPAEALMEQWTELKGNIVHVRNRLTCHRTDTIYGDEGTNDQEIPAVYPISSLNHLYAYQGDAPFTGEKVDSLDVSELIFGTDHFWGRYPSVPEHWMAFLDDDGWGMAVYSPSATSFLAGRFRPYRNGEANSEGTSYIAPTRRQELHKNSVVEYDYWLILGTLDEIREAVYKLHTAEQ